MSNDAAEILHQELGSGLFRRALPSPVASPRSAKALLSANWVSALLQASSS
jgi:hypothetical protein